MKALKIVLGLIIALVIIVAIVVTLVLKNINAIVKEAIETIGSNSLQTTVTVSEVDIKLTEGKGALRGFAVANPPGYSNNPVIKVGDVGLQIDIATLTSEVKVIKEIYIDNVALRAEQKNISDTNLQTLMDNLAGEPSAQAKVPPSESKSDIRLAIENLRVGESQIQLVTEKLGERSFTVPGYSQSNIGSKTRGLSPEEVGKVIVTEMLAKAKTAVANKLETLAKEEVKAKLEEKLKEELDNQQLPEKLEGVVDKEQLKSLFK